jgi:hypothetical protein
MALMDELLQAVSSGDVALARQVWRASNLGPDVTDSPTGIGGTPLLAHAIGQADRGFARELLEAGADVNLRGESGATPMFFAQDAQGVDLLLAFGGDPNLSLKRSGYGLSRGGRPLHRAATANDPALVQALIDAGADVGATDRYGRTAMHYAARVGGNVVRVLHGAGASLDVPDKRGVTPRQTVERIFPDFQMEGNMADAAVAIEQGGNGRAGELADSLTGFNFTVGKELKTAEGDYFFVGNENGEPGHIAFLPANGPLDGGRDFATADDLRTWLAGREAVEARAVEAFLALSEAEKARDAVRTAAKAQQVASEVENSIAPAPVESVADALASRLKGANWQYAYADDPAVRASGRAGAEAIFKDLAVFAKTDVQTAVRLWSEHGPKSFTAPAYLREALAISVAGVGSALPPVAAANAGDRGKVVTEREEAPAENTIQAAPAASAAPAVEVEEQATGAHRGQGEAEQNTIQPAPGVAAQRQMMMRSSARQVPATARAPRRARARKRRRLHPRHCWVAVLFVVRTASIAGRAKRESPWSMKSRRFASWTSRWTPFRRRSSWRRRRSGVRSSLRVLRSSAAKPGITRAWPV